jgi:hypothetical protein
LVGREPVQKRRFASKNDIDFIFILTFAVNVGEGGQVGRNTGNRFAPAYPISMQNGVDVQKIMAFLFEGATTMSPPFRPT